MIRRSILAVASIGILLILSQPAGAQTFGIGPHLSFVRGDLTTGTPSQRFTGATVRLGAGRPEDPESRMVRCRLECLSLSDSAAYVTPSGLCT